MRHQPIGLFAKAPFASPSKHQQQQQQLSRVFNFGQCAERSAGDKYQEKKSILIVHLIHIVVVVVVVIFLVLVVFVIVVLFELVVE